MFSIIALACSKEMRYGGVAQLARALGSYPGCHRFKSSRRYQNGSADVLPVIWPVGQAVKTPPFHGGIMGSIPVRVTTDFREQLLPISAYGGLAQLVRAHASHA